INQHDERAFPRSSLVVIVEVFHSLGFLDLNDRTGVDEQSRQRLGLLEQAATISSQVDDDAIDTSRLELRQDAPAIGRSADRVGITAQYRDGVAVEGRQADHADRDWLSVGALRLDDLALGMLFLELDLLACELVDASLVGAVRLHDEAHLGPAG